MKYAWRRGFKALPDPYAKSHAENLNCLNQIQSNSEKKNRTLQTPDLLLREPSEARKSVLRTRYQPLGGRREKLLLPNVKSMQPSFKSEKGRKRTYYFEMLFGSVIIQNQPQ